MPLPPAKALSGPTPAAAASPAPAPGARWRDGTYRAVGFSQFGDAEVTLTVADGRIAAVRRTRVTTYYPASVIAALPAQVVTRQDANVDLVSGATASSLAFRAAARKDLGQAKNP
jgi:uncharacterized protein with FMN-binding domain